MYIYTVRCQALLFIHQTLLFWRFNSRGKSAYCSWFLGKQFAQLGSFSTVMELVYPSILQVLAKDALRFFKVSALSFFISNSACHYYRDFCFSISTENFISKFLRTTVGNSSFLEMLIWKKYKLQSNFTAGKFGEYLSYEETICWWSWFFLSIQCKFTTYPQILFFCMCLVYLRNHDNFFNAVSLVLWAWSVVLRWLSIFVAVLWFDTKSNFLVWWIV